MAGPLCKGGQGPISWACPYYSRGTLIVMCIADLLRCSTCQGAWHKHFVSFITFIKRLVFFAILSALGHLCHFVPSTIDGKQVMASLICSNPFALLKYVIPAE